MKKILILFSIIFLSSTVCFAKEISTEAMLQYNQGIDYYKIGQYDEAIGCFRTAIKIDPNYIDAYYNLGSILEYLQQYDAALAVFKQIIVRKPDDYDAVYKAAWLSYKLNEPLKAKTYLSIIPTDCARSKDAKELAGKLNITSLIIPEKEQNSRKISKTNAIYNEIPAPTGITSDMDGNVYVAEFNTDTIIKITPDDKKTVYLKDEKISGPLGLAFDQDNNMYIANYNKNNVLKVSAFGEISVLIANIKKPYCIYVKDDVLFVSCQGTNSVLKYKLH